MLTAVVPTPAPIRRIAIIVVVFCLPKPILVKAAGIHYFIPVIVIVIVVVGLLTINADKWQKHKLEKKRAIKTVTNNPLEPSF